MTKQLPRWVRFGLLLGVTTLAQVTGLRPAHAGAWNKPQWGFFLQLGVGFSTNTSSDGRFLASADRGAIQVGSFYNPADRNAPPNGGVTADGRTLANVHRSNYQSLMTDLYFEISLLKRLAVFGDVAFVSARQQNDGGNISYSANGISDTMLGGRVAILERPVALALEVRLFIPSGDQLKIIPLGSGDFRGELRLALGKAWDNRVMPVYVEAETGVMLRGGATTRGKLQNAAGEYLTDTQYTPEFVLHGELGTAVRVKRQDRLGLSLSVDYRRSVRAIGSAEDSTSPANLTPSAQESTILNANVLAYIWRGIGVSARYSQACQGRNTLFLSTIYAGAFASF